MMIECFEPIIDNNTKVLILGSMPGKESLLKDEYYGNNRNHFWKILFMLFDEEYSEDYNVKISLIKNHNVGLWDVIHRCERKSSLDSDIRKAEINNFDKFFKENKGIKYIYINGGKAYDLFMKKVDKNIVSDKKIVRLESTSPARAIPFQNKLDNWKQIINL